MTKSPLVTRFLTVRSLVSILTITLPCHTTTMLVMHTCAVLCTVHSETTFRTCLVASLSIKSCCTATAESLLDISAFPTIVARF